MLELPLSDRKISNALRRRSLAAAYVNAGLWGMGSGLASLTLILFMARAVHAEGRAVSWILAAPSLAGLVRLATPAWLNRVASRRRFCIAMFLASAIVLAALPIISKSGVVLAADTTIFSVGATWGVYQVLEAIAVVALWSWLGDLVPQRVRGRFIGRREAWMNAGIVVGAVAAIGATELWPMYAAKAPGVDRLWQAYAACALAGASLFAIAALSLAWMSDAGRPAVPSAQQRRFKLRDLLAPLVDRDFRRLLTFGVWWSFANGIIQTPQSIFFINPLNLSFGDKKKLDGVSRGLKAALLPAIGSLADRRGSVRVLAASQAIIALAPLFLLVSSPTSKWWVLGAYACWLAYGGHDVALPKLMLGLSKPGETPAYAAAWFAWTQLAYSLSVLVGGELFDAVRTHYQPSGATGVPMTTFTVLFSASFVLKSLGVPLALRIREPKATT